MIGGHFQLGGFFLAAGLLVALAALVCTLLRANRPYPKMTLLLTLLENSPKEEHEPHSGGASSGSSQLDEVPFAGPRSFDFFA
jgi:hypothetical protein